MKQIFVAGCIVLTTMLNGGCSRNESERLADMADQTVEMQSKQNLTMSKANEEQAKLNREIQKERQHLNKFSLELERERQAIHLERRSELAWAESFRFLAIVIAAVVPLFLCAFLIWAMTRQKTNKKPVTAVLINDPVQHKPRLIASRRSTEIKTKSD